MIDTTPCRSCGAHRRLDQDGLCYKCIPRRDQILERLVLVDDLDRLRAETELLRHHVQEQGDELREQKENQAVQERVIDELRKALDRTEGDLEAALELLEVEKAASAAAKKQAATPMQRLLAELAPRLRVEPTGIGLLLRCPHCERTWRADAPTQHADDCALEALDRIYPQR